MLNYMRDLGNADHRVYGSTGIPVRDTGVFQLVASYLFAMGVRDVFVRYRTPSGIVGICEIFYL